MADALGTGLASRWTSAGPEFDGGFKRVSGPLAVGHAVARRFFIKLGSLSWAPNVGLDIREELNEDYDLSSDADLLRFASKIEEEARGDERVESARADVTFDADNSRLSIALDCETAEGPFRIVISPSLLTSDIFVEIT